MKHVCWVLASLLACACGQVNNGSVATASGCVSSTTYTSASRTYDLGVNDTATDSNIGGLRIAQSFVVPGSSGSTKQVNSISIPLYTTATLGAGVITLKVYTNVSGSPGTAVSGSTSTLTQSSMPSSITLTEFTFSNGLTLSSGETYWIVLDATYGQTSSPVLKWAADDVARGDTTIYGSGLAKYESDASPGPSGTWGTGNMGSGRELGFVVDCQ